MRAVCFKHPTFAALATSIAFVAIAQAQGVYKCVDGDLTTYQSMPCNKGQVETQIVSEQAAPSSPVGNAPIVRTRAPTVEAASSAADPVPVSPRSAGKAGKTWPGRKAIALGMSDDEVLNLPGWGIPTRIARAKGPQGWREEWTYQASLAQERQLRFANARLVEIVDGVAVPQNAQLALQ